MCICMITAVFTAVGLGIFLLTISMAKDIKDGIIFINKNAKNKKKGVQAFKHLTEFIQYHSDAKQWILTFIKLTLSNCLSYILDCCILDWPMIFRMFFNQYSRWFSHGVQSRYAFHYCWYKLILLSIEFILRFLIKLCNGPRTLGMLFSLHQFIIIYLKF